MKIHQLSLFLENSPGKAVEPCRLLARAGVNIRTLTIADTQQFGILRLIVSDWEKGRELLQQAGYVVNVTEVVAVEGTVPHYQIILTRQKGLDAIEVQVEITPEFFSDKVGAMEGLHERLVDALDHILGLRVAVRLVEPHTIQRSEGKAKRVIDRREP